MERVPLPPGSWLPSRPGPGDYRGYLSHRTIPLSLGNLPDGQCLRPLAVTGDGERRFEANLPVDRPLTEPDIALHLPGRYLILIEAKFTSPNGYYSRGPRRDGGSLTLDELLGIYRDPGLVILDHRRAARAERVPYQLWRNMVFAEWMAREDHPYTRAFHVNLVREESETVSAEEFRRPARPGIRGPVSAVDLGRR